MIDQIRQPIEAAFNQFETAFEEAIRSEHYLLKLILSYVRKKKGKQIRPQLVLLSSGLCGDIHADSIKAAVSMELLHTASLMHDDVVDNTYQRRSCYSVNALWNNKTAILVGDFFLSKAAFVASQVADKRVSEYLAVLGCDLSEGEIMQLTNERKLIIDEPTYLDVIKLKTAKTFAFCTRIGAICAQALTDQEEALDVFGEKLGMIFQLKDDIFDYFDQKRIGKPTSNDLKEGKMTLPLIYALNQAPYNQSKPILNIIRNKDFTHEKLAAINRFVKEYHGVDYAEQLMEKYREEALTSLAIFPDSDFKQALIRWVDYFMSREY